MYFDAGGSTRQPPLLNLEPAAMDLFWPRPSSSFTTYFH
uniref:Uncharacterized protein n=2 Tax=Picea TaxID=3328 RepID=A0A117NJA1_PICGL|nr:hypothetical protein ABT39_MTgene1094 [Picea glauca]QHR89972.1 hypothetical protein Q903MT_gene3994 [Picea sitchensis]